MDLWSLPPDLSTYGSTIDGLYHVIFVITAIAFVLVEIGIVWFTVRYRNRAARYTHGSNRLEVIWTLVPAATMVWLGVYSGGIWSDIKGRDTMPETDVHIGVEAKQFEWLMTYPGPDGRLGTGDDFPGRNDLRFPADTPVVVHLTSQDVIHSFFLPYLRIKQDAVPGMEIPVWFQATDTASIELACAELCGIGHSRMQADVEILSPAEYARWQAARGGAAPSGSTSSRDTVTTAAAGAEAGTAGPAGPSPAPEGAAEEAEEGTGH